MSGRPKEVFFVTTTNMPWSQTKRGGLYTRLADATRRVRGNRDLVRRQWDASTQPVGSTLWSSGPITWTEVEVE